MHRAGYAPHHPRQIQITNSLITNLIVRCSLPVSIVEDDGFRQFMHDVDPKYTMPSRSHVTSSLIPKLYEQKQMAVAKKLGDSSNVSITMDIWTDRHMYSFMACTGHTFVESKCESMLLQFLVQ